MPTRRDMMRGLGASLALAAAARAHDGPHEHEVRIARFAFLPARIVIRAGDSVTWTNGDAAPHTATARGEGRETGQETGWDTGALAKGEAARITFDTPGEHAYLCTYHPHMTGTVTVLPRDG